jgi:hypothetical protein
MILYFLRFKKKLCIALFLSVLSGCGDFPHYSLIKSHNLCAMSFPFSSGKIRAQYIGYFRIISTLRYLDEKPSIRIIINGPSHIQLEAGSVQKMVIDHKTYRPRYTASHIEGELQLWGPAFLFSKKASKEIFERIKIGDDWSLSGRLSVGKPYKTHIYNLFFESKNQHFIECIHRLLEPEDIKKL